MNTVCNLDDFFLKRLSVESLSVDAGGKQEAVSFGIDYSVFCNTENPRQIRMTLDFFLGPDDDSEVGCRYRIVAQIDGFFTFPDDIEEDHFVYLSRVNCATILYGILRGEIANVTGSFPGGKCLLPTVMMQDMVRDIEERRAGEEEAVGSSGSSDDRSVTNESEQSD